MDTRRPGDAWVRVSTERRIARKVGRAVNAEARDRHFPTDHVRHLKSLEVPCDIQRHRENVKP